MGSIETGLNIPQSGVSPVIVFYKENGENQDWSKYSLV